MLTTLYKTFINNLKNKKQMKKIFFFAAAALMSTAMFAQLQVATFEDVTLPGIETVLHLTETGTIQSGSFAFTQDVQDYGGGYVYYFGNVVSNKTSNQYMGDWQNDMSASGGAYEGNNFVVWTMSYYGDDVITLQDAAVVPGFYINNTPWVVDAILNGDGMSTDGAPFGENDWFKLTVNGSLNGTAVNTQVEFYLAQGTSYISDWTYVDLSTLGEVDEISFSLSSTKSNNQGMTTPAYFAIDNFGAANSESAISNTKAAEKAVKVVRNGQVVIVRGDKTFNVLGAEL